MVCSPKGFNHKPGAKQMHISYLQDANLPGFLIVAVFAGLYLSLKVAQSVGEKIFIQLVIVSLLTHKQELLLLPCHLVRAKEILETVMPD